MFGLMVPFDMCCPSIKEILSSRKCKQCNLYHSSQRSLKGHLKTCDGRAQQNSAAQDLPPPFLAARTRDRPVRIAAQRAGEVLTIWTSRINDQHIDWFDAEDMAGIPVEHNQNGTELDVLPVIDMETYMRKQWET